MLLDDAIALALKDARFVERFWSRVRRGGSDECWEWSGYKKGGGYGGVDLPRALRYGTHGKTYAHRVSWMLARGAIPGGLKVCHTCDNRPCCNPRHFFLGTDADNLRDMRDKGRGVLPPRLLGEAHARAVATEAQVREIRQRVAAGERQTDVARSLGLKASTVHLIWKRRVWRHVD